MGEEEGEAGKSRERVVRLYYVKKESIFNKIKTKKQK